MRNRGAILLFKTGRTQREIAARLVARGERVTQQTVSYWMLGEKKPRRRRRRALAIEFGIPPSAWDWPASYVPPPPPPWRAEWRQARRELRSALRLRLALATL